MNAQHMTLVRPVSTNGFARLSDALSERLGYTSVELQHEPLVRWLHPEDRAAFGEAVEGSRACLVARHATRDGGWIELDWRLETFDAQVYALGHVCAARGPDENDDSSDDDEAATTDSQARLLADMARIVESKNPGMRCSIVLVDRTRSHITVGAGPSLPDAYNRAVEGLRIGPQVGSCGTAAFWNCPVIVSDIQRDPLWAELRTAAELAGVGACWSQPILSSGGDVLGAMALYADRACEPERYQMDGLAIAARMVGLALERDRYKAKLYQAAKLESLGLLAAGLAHDFNNLMAVVLGNAELAMDFVADSAEGKQMLEHVVSAAESATDLCQQILTYAGKARLSTEALDCEEIVLEVVELMEVMIPKKLRVDCDVNGPFAIRADRNQVRQVLMNLITNAADSMKDHKGRIDVSVRARDLAADDLAAQSFATSAGAGRYVEFRVEDSGCGMSPEVRERIFDPFFTTKEHGTGLGLAAVQGIVQAHGGTLFVESDSGEGTRVCALFPLADAPAIPSTKSAPKAALHRAARILVVDDEPAVSGLICQVLRSGGMSVVEAHDGQEAVEIYRREHRSIDGVLLDFRMPKLDGEEVFRELKKIRRDVSVVLSTGYAARDVVQRFEGLAGVLQKPAKRSVLLETLNEALGAEASRGADS